MKSPKIEITNAVFLFKPYVENQLEPFMNNPNLENIEKYLQQLYNLHKKFVAFTRTKRFFK